MPESLPAPSGMTATERDRVVILLLTDGEAMTRAAMAIDAYVPLTAGNYEAGRRAFADALCAALKAGSYAE